MAEEPGKTWPARSGWRYVAAVQILQRKRLDLQPPSIEDVRKRAKVLVIDDHVFPAQRNFERDGYHFDRWPTVKNLRQLTEGDFEVILLDIHGVGVADSPDLQGLGILRAIKGANPAQTVIVYSSQPQMLSSTEYLITADAVFDKGKSYVEYKETVDRLLVRQATPGYFIAVMNRELGEHAALVPKAVPKALKSFQSGKIEPLVKYLGEILADRQKVATIATIVSSGIKVIRAIA